MVVRRIRKEVKAIAPVLVLQIRNELKAITLGLVVRISSWKNLADTKGLPETFQSFWKRIDDQNVKTREELDFLGQMNAEQEHESSIKIQILLGTANKQKIPIFTCFEDGFYGNAAKSKEISFEKSLAITENNMLSQMFTSYSTSLRQHNNGGHLGGHRPFFVRKFGWITFSFF